MRSPRVLDVNRVSYADILDVRRAMEVRVAELAAANRSDAAAAALRFAAERMAGSCRQRGRFVDADVRFHEALCYCSGNPSFALAGQVIRHALTRTIRAGFDCRRSEAEIVRVAQIHVELADAIAARSVTRARITMELHFAEAAASLADDIATH